MFIVVYQQGSLVRPQKKAPKESRYKKNIMTEGDNPPVGILLCTQKDHPLVEYALAGMDNQLFVSKYQLELPKKEEMQQFLAQQLKEVGCGGQIIQKMYIG